MRIRPGRVKSRPQFGAIHWWRSSDNSRVDKVTTGVRERGRNPARRRRRDRVALGENQLRRDALERSAKTLRDRERHARGHDRQDELRLAHDRIIVVDYFESRLPDPLDALRAPAAQGSDNPRAHLAQPAPDRRAHLPRPDNCDGHRLRIRIAHSIVLTGVLSQKFTQKNRTICDANPRSTLTRASRRLQKTRNRRAACPLPQARLSIFSVFRKAVHANAQLFCSLGPQDRENRQPLTWERAARATRVPGEGASFLN